MASLALGLPTAVAAAAEKSAKELRLRSSNGYFRQAWQQQQQQQLPQRMRRGQVPGVSSLALCRAHQQQQQQKKLEPEASFGAGRTVRSVILPLFAAALVGYGQIMDSMVTPSTAVALDYVDNASSGQDAYKDLLQKFRERQGQETVVALTTSAPELDQGNPRSAVARLREAAEKARAEREADRMKVVETRIEQEKSRQTREAGTPRSIVPAPPIAKEKPVEQKVTPQVAQVGVPTITKKQKTHGFLPLFLSQFLLLLATVGMGAALFVLPESKWKEAQEKFDELVEKATPVAEDAYAKAEPVATEAWKKAQVLGEQAKPYVVQMWQGAKPLAAKAVEASKPLLREAQLKASDLLQQAQERSKS
ncbi:unnamed protein product [Sphagnum troendelagicum]|uniref:Uncharacterized protein n=1 Tax=Sphagnum troendelagicum TaxID=128251 RepID=A0ABP0TZL5_9BRYO